MLTDVLMCFREMVNKNCTLHVNVLSVACGREKITLFLLLFTEMVCICWVTVIHVVEKPLKVVKGKHRSFAHFGVQTRNLPVSRAEFLPLLICTRFIATSNNNESNESKTPNES